MTKEGRVEELQALISLGKKKGYLTYEEINNRLPEDITSPEQIDRILIKLDEMDIEVIDSPREAGRPQAKKVAGPPSGGAEPEGGLSPAPVGGAAGGKEGAGPPGGGAGPGGDPAPGPGGSARDPGRDFPPRVGKAPASPR